LPASAKNRKSTWLVQAETDTAALAKVEKGVAGMIAASEDGLYQPAMKARMTELERQKAEITARLPTRPSRSAIPP
jgi:hypothetical protein